MVDPVSIVITDKECNIPLNSEYLTVATAFSVVEVILCGNLPKSKQKYD